jgi:hypothetical protein
MFCLSLRPLAVLVSVPAVLLTAGCSDRSIIVYNDAPTATITFPLDGAEVRQDEAIFFEGVVDDDRGVENLRVDWIDSVSGVLERGVPVEADGSVSLITSTLEPGPHTIVLRAIDQDAESAEDMIRIDVVRVPEKPSLEVVHPDAVAGERGLEGTNFAFTVQVSDEQDLPEDLVVELTADPFGPVCTMQPDGSGRATCAYGLPIGPYDLTFTVTDLDGNEAVATVPFAVVSRGDFDQDGDGFTPNGGDCNDSNVGIYPGAPEVCDGLDNDCNASTAIDVGTECYDDDADGYCERPPCANTDATIPDCDDANSARYPDPRVREQVNGVDDNCNGVIDEQTVVYDDDGDGFCESPPCVNTTSSERDCNDGRADISPGEVEVCGDGFDNDCNGLDNEEDAVGCTEFYRDEDGDTFGVPGATACYCEDGVAPWTGLDTSDCYDANANAFPGQTGYFGTHRGDSSFDYNCDGTQETRLSGRYSRCSWSFAPFVCNVRGRGWKSSEPRCGSAGTYVDDCDGTYDFACIAFCAYSDPSRCTSCWSCEPDESTETQSCR